MMIFSDRDLRLFEAARAIALTSKHYKARVGAILVDSKGIAGVGVNGIKSHPLQLKYNTIRFGFDDTADHLLHAELDAIIKGNAHRKRLNNPSIYIYRTMANGSYGIARPCKGCIEALRDFWIRDVYYTSDVGFAYEHLYFPIN